jgi:hypothetical protein
MEPYLLLNGNIVILQKNVEGNAVFVEIPPEHKDYTQLLSQVKNKKEVKLQRVSRVVFLVSTTLGALIGLGVTLALTPYSLDR